ncbi:hypothetical protein RA27_05805 [Ruegeria sp. ANG-R]|uniref:hypothetical protein n=1 Tax=Ruegeria sp. ANG-R TaxID=1577903 RepID=UPI00057D0502|nr:hypothetical protein [Ruegeria sp. ANG-R]KIC42844.1 hypothetical protein RA27_05805 [Ruegeria sp. ANG-R]
MHKTLSVLLISTMALSACNSWRNSSANPSNWFGSSTPSPSEVSPDDADALVPQKGDGKGLFARPDAEDNSVPIAIIDELRIDPIPSGAIIYAAGTAARQGAYNARLSRVESEELTKDGVMEFTFRVDYPDYATPQGTERSRMVSDAVNVSKQELEGIRMVRVRGQQNALESRRR